MALLLAGVALDVAQVFGLDFVLLCYLGSVDLSGWMAYLTASMTLEFLADLDLRLISR